ncbi:MAG: response regulator [Gammaproteobacteria bacterium]|nr:response regulator [Gammaproteobacteria bacterium]
MPDNNEHEKPQVLIADDSRVIRKSIVKMLGEEYQVLEAADGLEALEMLQQNDKIRLLFSDLGMPRMDGYELLAAVRGSEDAGLAELPVIIVTGKEDTEAAKEKLIELGATDLIGKPFHSAELKSRTRSYISLARKVKTLEQTSPIDKATGLATPDYFRQQTEITFSLCQRHGHDITLARLNIENFDALNAEYNKSVVARIIATIGKLLRGDMRKEDVATHLGAERFALMLPGADPEGANEVMLRIRRHLAKMDLRIGDKVAHIAFSAGIVSRPVSEDIGDFSQLMTQAEEALQQARGKGKEQTVILRPHQESAAPPPAPPSSAAPIDIKLDELLAQMADGTAELSEAQLTLALKKFLPLLSRADQKLKLGLGKVVLHLHRSLK